MDTKNIGEGRWKDWTYFSAQMQARGNVDLHQDGFILLISLLLAGGTGLKDVRQGEGLVTARILSLGFYEAPRKSFALRRILVLCDDQLIRDTRHIITSCFSPKLLEFLVTCSAVERSMRHFPCKLQEKCRDLWKIRS